MSFRRKIMYSFALLLAVSFGALCLLFYKGYEQEEAIERSYMKEYNEQMNMNLESIVSSVDSFRYLHFSDDKIRNLLYTDDSDIDPEEHERKESRLREELKLLVDMDEYALRATLVTRDGRVYSNIEGNNEAYLKQMAQKVEEKEWNGKMDFYLGRIHREMIHLVPYEIVSYISPVWNIVDEDPIAFLYVDLDFNKIENFWHKTAGINKSFEFMVIGDGQICYDTDREQKMSYRNFGRLEKSIEEFQKRDPEKAVLTINDKDCVIDVLKNESTGWYLVQYAPVSILTKRILENLWLPWLLVTGMLLLTAIGGYILAYRMSRPILELSRVMGEAARTPGEEKVMTLYEGKPVSEKDEVGQMINSYNEMAGRINDKIVKEYIYRLKQKQTELKMLQFQINPHFLYNALNTISSIAELQDVEFIPEIASSLSDMFRYNISEETIVTFREELRQTENYMSIQKIRFPERFVMKIEVEEALKDAHVLKFILQPVVENAYKYAFVKKGKKDILEIRGTCREEELVIEVRDNGVGIPQKKVSELNEVFRTSRKTEEQIGIGLKNVNDRIKNYYGEEYGIRIESEEGVGTSVYLNLKFLSDREAEVNK